MGEVKRTTELVETACARFPLSVSRRAENVGSRFLSLLQFSPRDQALTARFAGLASSAQLPGTAAEPNDLGLVPDAGPEDAQQPAGVAVRAVDPGAALRGVAEPIGARPRTRRWAGGRLGEDALP
jgi:hypothetical protein